MSHHHVYWHNHIKRYNNRMMFGPSRLVWFGIGSVATWAWIHHHRDQGSSCHRRVDYQRGRAQWEEREEAPHAPAPPPGAPAGEWRQTPSFSREWPLRPSHTPTHQGQLQGATDAAPGPTSPRFDNSTTHVGPSGSGQREQPLAEDSERLRQISRGAEETISDMSEATIDTMMGALQRLKDRLAERRGGQQLQEIGSQQANQTPATSPEEAPRPRHWV